MNDSNKKGNFGPGAPRLLLLLSLPIMQQPKTNTVTSTTTVNFQPHPTFHLLLNRINQPLNMVIAKDCVGLLLYIPISWGDKRKT